MGGIIVITGTNTGAGKTVLTALLAHHLSGGDQKVAALKPICSGGRDDARTLRKACGHCLPLDEVNPWHFRAALAPLIAARQQNAVVTLKEVAAHVRNVAHRFPRVLVEGAGGLLSPLGEHFCTRDVISALGSEVIIAAKNELGVVNHARLTVEALPPMLRLRARVALISPPKPDAASRSNAALLGEFMPPEHIVTLPWLDDPEATAAAAETPAIREKLSALVH